MDFTDLEIKVLADLLQRITNERKCIAKQKPKSNKKILKQQLAQKMAEKLGSNFLNHIKF